MIHNVRAGYEVLDNTGDLLRITPQLTEEDHDGPRVKLAVWNTGAECSVSYLSPDTARTLARTLIQAAVDAESAYGTIR